MSEIQFQGSEIVLTDMDKLGVEMSYSVEDGEDGGILISKIDDGVSNPLAGFTVEGLRRFLEEIDI